jgi:hypothetical protein
VRRGNTENFFQYPLERYAEKNKTKYCAVVHSRKEGVKMKKILLSVVAGWSFPCSGLPLAVEPGSVEFLNTGKVLPTNLPFSEAVRVGNTL